MNNLTPREKDVTNLVLKGMYNKEIADELGKSVQTVKNQLVSIYDKIGVRSKTELAIRFLKGD